MIDVAELDQASTSERRQVARAAVTTATSPEEKKEVAGAALGELTPEQRKDLLKTIFPTESGHRLWVYLAGFFVAGAVAIGLAMIAQSNAQSPVSGSILILATGFTSAILGGLLGAYVQR